VGKLISAVLKIYQKLFVPATGQSTSSPAKMTTVLKYIAVIVVCYTLILTVFEVRGFLTNFGKTNSVKFHSVETPKDTNFTSVTRQSYRPPSLPFSKKKLPSKLPQGVSEQDVKNVISITIHDVPHEPPKQIDIVQTKNDEFFVLKDSSISGVTVTTVEPRIFAAHMAFGLGITMDIGRIGLRPAPGIVLPSVVVSIFQWSGWLHAPDLIADLDGVGVGAQARVYHRIFLGVVRTWSYGMTGAEIKATLSFMSN